jgi:hypothetical protein
VIEIVGGSNFYNSSFDINLIPIEMSPDSAVFEKVELEVGKVFHLAKGKIVEINETGVFIYVF